jgi:hypothetical protein
MDHGQDCGRVDKQLMQRLTHHCHRHVPVACASPPSSQAALQHVNATVANVAHTFCHYRGRGRGRRRTQRQQPLRHGRLLQQHQRVHLGLAPHRTHASIVPSAGGKEALQGLRRHTRIV